MAHKFYCTHCARELNQDLVLLDMEPALTVAGEEGGADDNKAKADKFQLLKFRLTVAEFHALIARGTTGDLDFKHIDLSVEELAGYMANERNLNNPDIGTLTLADIDEYLENSSAKEFGEAGDDTDQSLDISLDNLFGGEEAAEETEDDAYTSSAAILALKNKISTAKGEMLNEQMLLEDLSMLRKFVGDNGCINIAVKVRTEKADTGDEMVIGYYARRGETQISADVRRCCHCGEHVFQHAGAAEHKAVAFIGYQGSGKTSTILALTHYAQRAARRVDANDEIWCNSSSISGIEVMEVVGAGDRLKDDLRLYDIGVAPEKTKSKYREDAYSATLWITNSQGRKFILTLIDLPGELCLDDGTLKRDDILTKFPVAMASDVFVMCFDTVESKGANASLTVSKTCSWAHEFQQLRRDYKKASMIAESGAAAVKLPDEYLAPMMIVFTKCEELEEGAPEVQKEKTYINPRRVDEIYSLKVEREFIDKNPVYKDVGDMVRVYEDLKHAYIARLRTSPYGFAASNKETYWKNNNANKNSDGSIKYPRSKHVDKLMKWLMVVCGCVPATAEYIPNPKEPEHVYRPENVYVHGAQYRFCAPQGKSHKDRVNEAMCRAYLFENYSAIDQGYIEHYNDPSWHPGSTGRNDTNDGIIDRIRRIFGL